MTTDTLFADKSALYAAARPRYPKAIYAYLAGACEKTRSAWDCACGSGQVAVDLAPFFDRVLASDVSAQQIAEAQSCNGVNYCVSRAEKTAFASASFDCVCAAQALHWFDYNAFWRELDRVLVPGGVFAYWGYNFPRVDEAVDAELANSLYPVIAGYWAPQNKLLWDEYRDLNVPFTALNAPKFELFIECNQRQFLDFLHTWSAVRRCIDDQGDSFFAYFSEQLARLWPAHERRRVDLDLCFSAYRKRR